MSYFSFNNRPGNGATGRPANAGATQPAGADNSAPMSIGIWGNDPLDNDDFDSDQLDEDESYSWASGITDHQDGPNGNGANGPGSNINWRDWRSLQQQQQRANRPTRLVASASTASSAIPKLVDLCAQFIAANIPFELVESFRDPVPEDLQLKITYASFPQSIDNIRLYSCLANGCVDEYTRGEQLFSSKCVRKCIQIGFHLSAQVLLPAQNGSNATSSNAAGNSNSLALAGSHQNHHIGISLLHYNQHSAGRNAAGSSSTAPAAQNTQPSGSVYANVAVICDRKRIISCSCTCSKQALPWCSHIVAVCLNRILDPESVEFRAPVSESLSKLHREQLQKFAQYLISELPTQILPTAQKLLDELLKDNESSINVLSGAPDPTAGASQDDISVWCLDDLVLKENIHKTLQKSIIPVPNIVCDLEGLDQNSSATAIEFTNLLKPLRGHEPEGMWNLISIVREMFRRNDKNSIPILRMITLECLNIEQIIHLWFLVKSSQLYYDKTLFNLVTLPSSMSGLHRNGNVNANASSNNNAQTLPVHQACACLMDEIVMAWRLACLDPALTASSDGEIELYREQLVAWQNAVFESIRKYCTNIASASNQTRSSPNNGSTQSGAAVACEKHLRRLDIDIFSGFLPAILASQLSWSEFNFGNFAQFESRLVDLLPKRTLAAAKKADSPRTEEPPSRLEDAMKAVSLKEPESEAVQPKPVESVAVVVATSSPTEPVEKDMDELFSLYTFEYDPLKMIKPQASSAGRAGRASGITDELSRLRAQFLESANFQSLLASAEFSFDMLFARCEALFAHGHNEHACLLAKILAEFLLRLASRAKSKFELAGLSNTPSLVSARTQPLQQPSTLKSTTLRQKFVCNFYNTVLYRSTVLANILFETSSALPASFERNFVRLDGPYAAGETDEEAAEHVGQSILAHYPRSLSQLAFRIGVFGLEMPRMPAISKALEVRLINQEQELVGLVKRMPVSKYELSLLRDRASLLGQASSQAKSAAANGPASTAVVNASYSLPIMLASLIFDILLTSSTQEAPRHLPATNEPSDEAHKTAEDQQLAFEAALNVLGMKTHVNESQHSLLCEGIRRQKGDLTLNLLLTYKDDEQRLLRIIDKILDRDVHVLFKPGSVIMLNPFNPNFKKIQHQQLSQFMHAESATTSQHSEAPAPASTSEASSQSEPKPSVQPAAPSSQVSVEEKPKTETNAAPKASTGGQKLANKSALFLASKSAAIDSLSSGWEESENESPNLSSNVSLLEMKHRCLNQQKHLAMGGSGSRAAADATTTSSDNSPTVTRKAPPLPPPSSSQSQSTSQTAGASGSDATTAKKSSTIDDSDDSVGESSSSSRGSLSKKNSTDSSASAGSSNLQAESAESAPKSSELQTTELPSQAEQDGKPSEATATATLVDEPGRTGSKAAKPRSGSLSGPAASGGRPLNQPSGALAHFLLEFSRTVLSKAGGTASTVVFQNHPGSGPHRNLHICSFLIALYGLGIHNCLHNNWMQRNYSSAVSWITSQAVDIGFPAICILIECWQGRLTPSECVSLADKVSRGRDSMAVKAAAELALSSLSHANLMNSSEIQRALIQCKEQNNEMLQRACVTVEHALKDGTSSITLEVLFSLARRWEELFNETVRANSATPNAASTSAAAAAVPGMGLAFGPASMGPMTNADLIYYNQNPQLNLMLGGNKAGMMNNFNAHYNAGTHLHQQQQQMLNAAAAAAAAAAAGGAPAFLASNAIANFQAQQQISQFGGGVNVNVNVNMGINASNSANFNSLVKNLPVTVLSSNLPGAQVGPGGQQQSAFMGASNVFMPSNLPHFAGQQSQQPPPQQFGLNYNPNLMSMQAANYHQQQRYQMQNYLMQQQYQQQQQQMQASLATTSLEPLDSVSLKHLTSAFRVGLLGLEALPKRHETPGMIRWRQNTPPYAEDVKWLCSVAIKLDTYLKNNNHYLQQFCQAAALSITNPCLMQDIAVESARYLCRANSINMKTALCSTTLQLLTEKCMNTHFRCFTSGKQNHSANSANTNANHNDEFINALFHAQEIFVLADKMAQFGSMIDAIKRVRKREKDLIHKLDAKMQYMNMANSGAGNWMASGQ